MITRPIPLLTLLFTYIFNGCSASTVYHEKGSSVCLDLGFKNHANVGTVFISRNHDKSICYSLEVNHTQTFPSNWINRTFSCSRTATLMSVCFENFTLNDIGNFTAFIGRGENKTILESLTLEQAIPVASVTLTSTPKEVIAGNKMTLKCVTGDCIPSANITWTISSSDFTRNSTQTTDSITDLVRTTSTLQIEFIKSDNGKEVFCTAKNIPDKSVDSRRHKVIVLYKPEVTSRTPSIYEVTEGQTATLECEVDAANPETNITWKWFNASNHNDVFYNGPKYVIPNIQRNRSGSYSCTASNSIGSSEAITINMDILYKPEVTSRTPSIYKVTEGQTATLECDVAAANPNTSIRWTWFNASNHNDVFYNGPKYVIPIIQRNQSGSYSCTASNSIGSSEAITINMDILYKPQVMIRTASPYKVLEGTTATLTCFIIDGNPQTNITWKWFHANYKDLYNGETYKIPEIKRTNSGLYNCTATNTAGTSVAATVYVDVQYKPEILNKSTTIVNETDYVVLSREIVSNPLANVFWYNGSQLLDTQIAERNATFIINRAMCTDTKNFTLVASNTVKENVSALVELIVNCKPRSIKTNFTLGVTDSTGIEFSTTVIAYPKPLLDLKHENGTKNNQMTKSIIRNGTNTFTIHLSQAIVNQSDFGVYHLIITNAFGNITIFVNVVPQRKPTMPENIEIKCDVTRARVQWTSSFNGGDIQTFTVFALNGQQSNTISDKGENEIHEAYVQNLQSSTTYVFYVSARNTRGFSLSNNISCTTLAESSDNLPLIAGGAAAGGIALAIIVIVLVLLLRVYTKHEKQAGKSQRFENEVAENKEADDDGMRDNILYVSAGPKVDEKPEAAVYAAVNKKTPESNNNANAYAEVNKSGHIIIEGALYSDVKPKRGFFKKDLSRQKDENPKKKKGKKQKSKQDVADVYENSEDIAMSSKRDNVYSNTGQKVQNKEERGYKNKDGLLYVEVQFDAKTEKGNQTIHGEDEKTDYATVEFPMAASTH